MHENKQTNIGTVFTNDPFVFTGEKKQNKKTSSSHNFQQQVPSLRRKGTKNMEKLEKIPLAEQKVEVTVMTGSTRVHVEVVSARKAVNETQRKNKKR